ncbi:TlpA disulfide reductase family protein [Corynebacterium jeikeium]|uniref:TlpA disulfide reductase family protein n=1 Tax=Corynebacterium jeikeium TaxID=38289 RepID=UPI00030BCCF4|nr:TlpA disulfide reductase family protein [Corynebacterium jeikeium]WCZ54550.1 Thiol:disulfide interchange protein TlpA [Corynebacterium jeikeium]SUY82348.1 thiol-disulfide isomerase/thioredoxin [Corynebacterium jeikeium]
MRKKLTAVLAATLLASGAVLTACGEGNTAGKDAVASGGTFEFVAPGGQTSIHYKPEERKEVADFTGTNLDGGDDINLSDFEGQVVVLNAWGQWCGPCRSESDDLQRVQEKLEKHGGGTVLGINVRDNVKEKPQDFVKDNGITYPSIYDPPFKTALALGGVPASVIPTTIVLDKQHRPAHIFLKEITDKELWEQVEPLLDEEA